MLIEDDIVTSTFLRNGLNEHGFDIVHFKDGQKGYEELKYKFVFYDLLVLDILLPSMDGLKICKKIRENNIMIPILMLSGRDSTEEKVQGLDAGANDYLTKPFELEELIARIKAILRSYTPLTEPLKLKIKNVELNESAQEIQVDGKAIDLTATEFKIISLLMKNKDQLVTRSTILEKVWGNNASTVFSNTINVHIQSIRKKLSSNQENHLIHTVRGRGYKFSSS